MRGIILRTIAASLLAGGTALAQYTAPGTVGGSTGTTIGGAPAGGTIGGVPSAGITPNIGLPSTGGMTTSPGSTLGGVPSGGGLNLGGPATSGLPGSTLQQQGPLTSSPFVPPSATPGILTPGGGTFGTGVGAANAPPLGPQPGLGPPGSAFGSAFPGTGSTQLPGGR
jgi:hypothetical protein